MDFRNVLLAILLSTAVLVGWATFFEPPIVEREVTEKTITENEDLSSPSIDKEENIIENEIARNDLINNTKRVNVENENIKGSISLKGAIIDDILFTHGHAMPKPNFSRVSKIIMGHVHPVFFSSESILNGQRIWITMKLLKEQIFPESDGIIEITIVPSFNKFFYSMQKKFYKKSISPIIHKIDDVISARILTLDGTIIGDESSVFNLI